MGKETKQKKPKKKKERKHKTKANEQATKHKHKEIKKQAKTAFDDIIFVYASFNTPCNFSNVGCG